MFTDPTTAERWMVLGSSPSAPQYHETPQVDKVVAAGDAILLRDPDTYVITEHAAVWPLVRHERALEQARARGVRVYYARPLQGLVRQERRHDYVIPCDGFIDIVPCYYENPAYSVWEPGMMCVCCGGVFALQWAVNHGAKEVHVVGLEGYRGDNHIDYFTGQRGNRNGTAYMTKTYIPLVNRIIACLPDVRFVFYGPLTYELTGDNVTLVGAMEPQPQPEVAGSH